MRQRFSMAAGHAVSTARSDARNGQPKAIGFPSAKPAAF
ncbi:hypothetical protein RNAN_2185 [Rheinheimera nanhaiensis E407-8]|uniref:Uncharacterized protein n=1 Tax=Rheinheimera nanhaiensis E407-8 TaxID=562729 RepID=I1DYR5_9GAMM|nr:hypothetical protein RNAN_2185 [Rheinheimera nanhaiensis E407-8]